MSYDDTLSVVLDDLELFHTPAREAYATLSVQGHRETWALASKEFRYLLERHLYGPGHMKSDTCGKKILPTFLAMKLD